MYLSGSNDLGYIYMEKRSLGDGSLNTEFGTSGIYNGFSISDAARALVIDNSYMYIAGDTNESEWQIEKHSIIDGTLDINFGILGVVTISSLPSSPRGIIRDNSSIITLGTDGSGDLYIDKRFMNDGLLDMDFGTLGKITETDSTLFPYAVVSDDLHFYIVGGNNVPRWVIEKRMLSSGSLDAGFGIDGSLQSGITGDKALDVTIDTSYLYIVGDNGNNDWRIEKRLLSDGSLETDFDTDGSIVSDSDSDTPYSIAIDTTHMYIVGTNSDSNWRIEKRLLSDGSLNTDFGILVIATSSTFSNTPNDIVIDGIYMYIIGYNDILAWRIEKRLLSDGSLDITYGSGGFLTSDSSSNIAYSIAIDSIHTYVVGDNKAGNWRIEKRLKNTGDFPDFFPNYKAGFTDITPIAGKTGQAFSFDGVDDYVDAGNIASSTFNEVIFNGLESV